MIELNAKLLDVRPLVPYYRRDEMGNVMNDAATGAPLVEGHRRQVVFATLGLKPDVLPFTLFHDEARGFDIPLETRGTLRFTVKGRPRRGEETYNAELVLVDFVPCMEGKNF